jgi:glutathione S-transferase
MITIHCLAFSRAIRLVWLMEDLKQPYKLVGYDRTAQFRAPQSLSKVHPLGSSPVIEDGDLVMAESVSCLRYIASKFGDDTHRPAVGTMKYWQHEEMLDYVECSFSEVAMKALLPKFEGDEPSAEAREALHKHFDYIAQHLTTDELLFGSSATLADIQFSYLLAFLSQTGLLKDTPRLTAYWAALQDQSGYKAAIAAAGPMVPDM